MCVVLTCRLYVVTRAVVRRSMQFNSSTEISFNAELYGCTIHTVLGFSVIAVELDGDVALGVGNRRSVHRTLRQ